MSRSESTIIILVEATSVPDQLNCIPKHCHPRYISPMCPCLSRTVSGTRLRDALAGIKARFPSSSQPVNVSPQASNPTALKCGGEEPPARREAFSRGQVFETYSSWSIHWSNSHGSSRQRQCQGQGPGNQSRRFEATLANRRCVIAERSSFMLTLVLRNSANS